VGDEGHAGGQQFGPRRLDLDGTVPVHAVEGDAVVGAGLLAVFELGLGHGGTKVHVPQCRGLPLIDMAGSEEVQEAPLDVRRARSPMVV